MNYYKYSFSYSIDKRKLSVLLRKQLFLNNHITSYKNYDKRYIETIAIAMSGGIDSSAAAMILKDQGYNCIGVYMKNWDYQDEYGNSPKCNSINDYQDMVSVCNRLDIPFVEVSIELIDFILYYIK